MSGFGAPTLAALKKRSRGICEACGLAEATEAHHRQYRSRGGPDTLSNALHLCGWGNHTGCHGKAHTGAGEARGWSVRSGWKPLEIPALIVVDFRQVWVRFDNDGGHKPLHPITAREQMVLIGAIRTEIA
jgi:hypothetical protein